jgi:hypothetical protein
MIRSVGSSPRLRRQRLPLRAPNDWDEREAADQQQKVHAGLNAGRVESREQVRVRVAGEEQHLKEDHAGGPHTGRSAEPREDVLGDQRLDLKEQERAGENRQRIDGYEPRGAPPATFDDRSGRRCGNGQSGGASGGGRFRAGLHLPPLSATPANLSTKTKAVRTGGTLSSRPL